MAYWRQNCTAFFYEINPDEEFDMIYQQSALLPRSISNHILVNYLSNSRPTAAMLKVGIFRRTLYNANNY